MEICTQSTLPRSARTGRQRVRRARPERPPEASRPWGRTFVLGADVDRSSARTTRSHLAKVLSGEIDADETDHATPQTSPEILGKDTMLRLSDRQRHDWRAIYDMDAGPDRLAELVRQLEDDLAQLPPLTGDLPLAVADALTAHVRALDVARQSIREHSESEEGIPKAEAEDVSRLAAALKTGKGSRRLCVGHRLAARPSTRASRWTPQRRCWGRPRRTHRGHPRQLDGPARRFRRGRRERPLQAAEALGELIPLLESTVANYRSVSQLDSQVRARFADVQREVDGELREGIHWFAASTTPRIRSGMCGSRSATASVGR